MISKEKQKAINALKKSAPIIAVTQEEFADYIRTLNKIMDWLEQEPTEKCIWIKYDYRTMCPKEHDIDNPYWRIPKNRMKTLKYCPYCGKEIEVEDT